MSLVKEMELVYAAHECGTTKFQILQGPQNVVPLTIELFQSVFQLSICDMHFYVHVFQSVDECKLAERVGMQDALCEEMKWWLPSSTFEPARGRCLPRVPARCGSPPDLGALSWQHSYFSPINGI